MSKQVLIKQSAQLIKHYQNILHKLIRRDVMRELYLVKGIKRNNNIKSTIIKQLLQSPVQKIRERVDFFQRHSIKNIVVSQQIAQKIQNILQKKNQKDKIWDELALFQSRYIQKLIRKHDSCQYSHLSQLLQKQYPNKNKPKLTDKRLKQKFIDQTQLDNYFPQQLLKPYQNNLFNTNQHIILPQNQMNYFFFFPPKRIIQQYFFLFTKRKADQELYKFKQMITKDNIWITPHFFDIPQKKRSYTNNPHLILNIFTAYNHYKFLTKKLALQKAFTQISFVQNFNFRGKILFLAEEYKEFQEFSKNLLSSIKIPFLNRLIKLIQNQIKRQPTTIQLQEYFLNILKITLQRPQILKIQNKIKEGKELKSETQFQAVKILADAANVFKVLKNSFQMKQSNQSKDIFIISSIIKNYIKLNEYFNSKIPFLHVIYGYADKNWNQKLELGIVNLKKDFSNENSNLIQNKELIQQYLHKGFRFVAGFQAQRSDQIIDKIIKPLQIFSLIQNIIDISLRYPNSLNISQNFLNDIILFLQHQQKNQKILRKLQIKQNSNLRESNLLSTKSMFSVRFYYVLFKAILSKDIKILQKNNKQSNLKGMSLDFIQQFLIQAILTSQNQIVQTNNQIKNFIAYNNKQIINTNGLLIQKFLNILKCCTQMHKTFGRMQSFLVNVQVNDGQPQKKHSKINYRLLQMNSWIKQLLSQFQISQNSKILFQKAYILQNEAKNTWRSMDLNA